MKCSLHFSPENKLNYYLDIILVSRLGLWSMQPLFAGNEMTEDRRTCYCCLYQNCLYIFPVLLSSINMSSLFFDILRNTTMERA